MTRTQPSRDEMIRELLQEGALYYGSWTCEQIENWFASMQEILDANPAQGEEVELLAPVKVVSKGELMKEYDQSPSEAPIQDREEGKSQFYRRQWLVLRNGIKKIIEACDETEGNAKGRLQTLIGEGPSTESPSIVPDETVGKLIKTLESKLMALTEQVDDDNFDFDLHDEEAVRDALEAAWSVTEANRESPSVASTTDRGVLKFKATRINNRAFVELFEKDRTIAVVWEAFIDKKDRWQDLYLDACREADRLNWLLTLSASDESAIKAKAMEMIKSAKARLIERGQKVGDFQVIDALLNEYDAVDEVEKSRDRIQQLEKEVESKTEAANHYFKCAEDVAKERDELKAKLEEARVIIQEIANEENKHIMFMAANQFGKQTALGIKTKARNWLKQLDERSGR